MKLLNVLAELMLKPTLLPRDMHMRLTDIVMAHATGAAHSPDGCATQWAKIGDPKSTVREERQMDLVDRCAVIPVHGVIAQGLAVIEDSSGVVDSYNVAKMIRLAVESPDVDGILYDFDSPGGSVTGTPELAARISAASALKPSLAYTDSLMASAAYWLASQCEGIYASQSAAVGSIGVYMAWLDQSRAMEMAGMKTELFKAGKFKALGLPGTTLTDEARAMLQASVDKIYGWFTAAVRERRDVSDEAMQGQVFYADDAAKANLIDAVGSREEALTELKDMIAAKKGMK